MSHRLSREELYKLVWSEPLRTLAKRLDMSDAGLAKTCRRAGIPLPGVGYWAKKAAGKTLPQPKLPPRALGHPEQVELGKRAGYYADPGLSDEAILSLPLPPRPTFAESLDEITARAREMLGKRVRMPRLARPHPVIKAVLDEDARRREAQLRNPHSWQKPTFDSRHGRRQLTLVNAVFIALTRCGCSATIHVNEATENTEFRVKIGEHRLFCELKPVTIRGVPRKSQTADRQGLLMRIACWQPLAGTPTSWQDGPDVSLEDQIDEICLGLLIAGELIHRGSVVRRYEWRLQRKKELEEELRRQEEEARTRAREAEEKLERARLNALLADVTAWRHAAEIRAFVSEVRRAAEAGKNPFPSAGKLERWMTWALEQAERMDPLINARLSTRIAVIGEA